MKNEQAIIEKAIKVIESTNGPENFEYSIAFVELAKEFISHDAYKRLLTVLSVKAEKLTQDINDQMVKAGLKLAPSTTIKTYEPVHNIFTSPGPDAPIQELANTIP